MMKEEKKTNDDIFFLLTYMTAIATSDIERDKIFRYASEQQEYSVSKYFKQIYTLASKWGYEYSKACKLLSKKVSHTRMSEFLGRMATALASGEPEKDFLLNERTTGEEVYSNEYETSIEALKKWTDGYTALLVSVSLIVTMVLISTMIYEMGNLQQVTSMVLFLLFFICGLGILLVYDAAPFELKVHSGGPQSREQRLAVLLSKILLPAGFLVTVFLLFRGVQVAYILIAAGAFMLPVGAMSIIDDRNIDKRDKSFPAFAKSLGTLAGTMGVTTTSAMKQLDRETVGFLEPLVEKLHTGLSLGIRPELCWLNFVGESGSELINRSSKIFNDAIDLGGDPIEIGQIVSASSLAIVLLRMKRKLVSSNFTGLIIVLHAIMVGLLVFIIEIMKAFGGVIEDMCQTYSSDISGISNTAGLGMSLFNVGSNIDFLYRFTIETVIILTIADSIVVKVVDGGWDFKVFFYGAIMSVTSGLVLKIVPFLVSRIFSFDL